MRKRGLPKLEIIILWILISTGIYWIATRENRLPEKGNEQKTETQDMSREIPDEQQVEPMDTVRILIKTSDYADSYHQNFTVSGREGLRIQKGNQEYIVAPEETVSYTYSELKGERLIIHAQNQGGIRLHNVKRSEEVSYRGIMECIGTEQGIVLINQVGLEEYLYGVVQSEMPASYPFEALKAQAISARTYVYYHGSSYAYPEWKAHVDDSTAYQVYMNLAENETVNRAVMETCGKIMLYQGKVIESFYYATSSGCGSGYEVWGDDRERKYLQAKHLTEPKMDEKEIYPTIASQNAFSEETYRDFIDYGRKTDIEYEEPWYRWKYSKELGNEEKVSTFMKQIYELSLQNPEQIKIQGGNREELYKEKEIRTITVGERTASGMVNLLYIQTAHFLIEVTSQHTIRQVLATAGDMVEKRDGTTYTLGTILPSAYFYIENEYENAYGEKKLQKVILHGGGMGHGAGMSQNGAKCLARKSFTAEEILHYYYDEIEIITV